MRRYMRLIVVCGLFGLCLLRVGAADIVTADVAVQSPGGKYAPLKLRESINTNWNRYAWYDVPELAGQGNFLFWQTELTGFSTPADGITTFKVLTDGPVLMAVTTRWAGGGNSSGNWKHELTTREELQRQGWTEIAMGLADSQGERTEPDHEYIIFCRESCAGEVFTYRTEKYRAPIILRSETVTPERTVQRRRFFRRPLGLLFFRRR